MSYTQKPWFIDGRYLVGEDGDVVVAEFATWQPGTVSDPNEREGNAHLLQAAPDLYEALKACAGVLSGDDLTKNDLVRSLEMARKALAKADGHDPQP